jgi:hypothetical protein
MVGLLYGFFVRESLLSFTRRAFLWIVLAGMIMGGLLGFGLNKIEMNVVTKNVKPKIAYTLNGIVDSLQQSIYQTNLNATATAQAGNPPEPRPRPTPPLQKPVPSNVFVPLSVAFAVALGLMIGIVCGLVVGIVGFLSGIRLGLKSDLVNEVLWDIRVCSVLWGSLSGFVEGYFSGLGSGIVLGIFGCLFYNIAYAADHYKMPLFCLGEISILMVYLNSRKKNYRIFSNLHASWLYASEEICLPLLSLQWALLIAVTVNAESTLEEVQFLTAERPHQMEVVKKILCEYALQIVDSPKTLRDIAELSRPFDKFHSEWNDLIDLRWAKRFTAINRICNDAIDYQVAVSWQKRIDALTSMKLTLDEVIEMNKVDKNERATYPDDYIYGRAYFPLQLVMGRWSSVVQHELDRLEQDRPENDQIANPYVPGAVLKLGTTLFVGRQDLAMQLELALAQGNHRPTFFLNGERRVGKSSTLRQLPKLLRKQYLPIFYDLQNPGIISSTTAFLNAVATEIYKGLVARGIQAENLEHVNLQEATRQNEAASYAIFDAWLDKVEEELERSERTLFLTFDEFEKLEDAGKANYLDLKLLLNWFRSTIQNRARVALLFSGLHTLGEMSSETGINWAGYFVNVQTVKVGFLHWDEAHQLITRPVPDFFGTQIFGEDVVDEIIHVTGCHPFLVQAICSVLIDNLNADKRFKAEVQDVANAVKLVFERWWDSYFRDLWERTDLDQQVCLVALRALGEGNHQQILQQSSLDNSAVREALQRLYQRDLVLLENEHYRIAAPIFSAWVERNN